MLETAQTSAKQAVKNANWEVILTDPSLNKFNFGRHITDKYLMTDIISPHGQKSILYNTVTNLNDGTVVIGLNFEEIDQTNIGSISVKSSEAFFENWKVVLKNNRNGEEVAVSSESIFELNPVIEINKLMDLGFIDKERERRKPLFELHISRS